MKARRSGQLLLVACLLGAAIVVAACGATGEATYSDPFAYCRAVDTIDTPDARYTGPEIPDEVAQGLQVALGLPTGTPAPPIAQNSYWRCMDGQVYACTVGANLPCLERANTDRTPTEEMAAYCKENPTSDFIPAVVTGRDTVYEWHCSQGTPEAGDQVLTADARGFLSEYWYKIEQGGQ